MYTKLAALLLAALTMTALVPNASAGDGTPPCPVDVSDFDAAQQTATCTATWAGDQGQGAVVDVLIILCDFFGCPDVLEIPGS